MIASITRVAQTAGLLFRRRPVCEARKTSKPADLVARCRRAVGDTADRRSALHIGTAFALAVLILCAFTTLNAPAQSRTNRPPSREEILRGALTPLRTCYDVTSYDLDVRIDPETKSIKGSNKILFKAMDDFDRMQVDLFTNMAVEKIVFDDTAPATFTRELTAIYIQLPSRARKRSVHSVTIHYSGEPMVARRPPWQGGFTWEHDTNGNPWVVVTCEETGASLWWPNKDHPSDKPDSMTLSITVPPGLEDISNGRLKSRTVLPDGWTRFEWAISYPINNYCVTFNIGKYAHFDDEYVSADGQKLTLDYYVLPENLDKAKEQFKQVKTMLSAFEKYFGKYPFYRDGYKLIECPHTGMEHQTAVAYGNRYQGGYRGRASSDVGRKFDFIIIHESAHEWWGNNITEKDSCDMWIHESFGAYAESLYVEDQWGRAEALNYINAKKRGVRNRVPIVAERGVNRRGDGDMYDKGQLILNTLRSIINDDTRWVAILRGLQQDFRYSNASSDDVFHYINKKSGKDLSCVFDQYFRHAAIPQLMIETKQEGDDAVVRYRWQADVADFRMPVKVTTAPDKFDFVKATDKWQTLKLHGMKPEEFKVAEDLFYVNVKTQHDGAQTNSNGTTSQ